MDLHPCTLPQLGWMLPNMIFVSADQEISLSSQQKNILKLFPTPTPTHWGGVGSWIFCADLDISFTP